MVILCCVGSGLLAFASGSVLWDTWSHKDGEYLLPFHLAKDSLFTSFTVGLCLLGGAGCFVAFAFQALFTHQLILGQEVLQVTRAGLSGRTVTLQVPYANIAAVACERETYGFKQLRVGLDLRDPLSEGTYVRGYDFHKKEKEARDAYLPGFLAVGPEELAQRIAERCGKNEPA
jgi:hypothetical protein